MAQDNTQENVQEIAPEALFNIFKHAFNKAASQKLRVAKNYKKTIMWSSNGEKKTPNNRRRAMDSDKSFEEWKRLYLNLWKKPLWAHGGSSTGISLVTISDREQQRSDEYRIIMKTPFNKESMGGYITQVLEFIDDHLPELDKTKFIEALKEKIITDKAVGETQKKEAYVSKESEAITNELFK